MANLKNLRLIPNQEFFCLFLVWFGLSGLASYIVGLNGQLNQANILILSIIPLVLLLSLSFRLFQRFIRFTLIEKILCFLIAAQFLLYSLGLVVPETGFDALWYHLPEALRYTQTGQITKIPEIMYSTMPRLGEMYFTAAFFTHSLVFVKLVSFIFALFLILESYFLSRYFLSRPHSLLVALTVNSLYLIAWQSSSAYVDLPRAVFELGSLLCLFILLSKLTIKPLVLSEAEGLSHIAIVIWLSLSAILIGFALSVKIQGLIGLIALSVFLVFVLHSLRINVLKILFLVSCFLFLAAFTAAPWYLDNYLQSGHPLFPINTPEIRQNILTHVGAATETEWLIRKFTRLPLVFYDLGTKPVYQLTPIIAILFPILLFRFKFLVTNSKTLFFISYSLIYIVLWWFLPPPESRYLLPVLPPLIILLFYSVFSMPNKYTSIKQIALVFIFISLALNFCLRVAASRKYWPVILGTQSPEAYITSQTSDFNKSIVEKFYSSFWPKYSPR